MRKRKDIANDGTRTDMLCLEVLLDIRDLLEKKPPEIPKRKRTESQVGRQES